MSLRPQISSQNLKCIGPQSPPSAQSRVLFPFASFALFLSPCSSSCRVTRMTCLKLFPDDAYKMHTTTACHSAHRVFREKPFPHFPFSPFTPERSDLLLSPCSFHLSPLLSGDRGDIGDPFFDITLTGTHVLRKNHANFPKL